MTTEISILLDEHYSMKSKRIKSDIWFVTHCPECGSLHEINKQGSPLFYVPEDNPSVHFYCDECEHEDELFYLQKIIDQKDNCYAVVTKNEKFGDVQMMIEKPILLQTV